MPFPILAALVIENLTTLENVIKSKIIGYPWVLKWRCQCHDWVEKGVHCPRWLSDDTYQLEMTMALTTILTD